MKRFVILSVVMKTMAILTCHYAGDCYTECRYDDCNYVEFCYTECCYECYDLSIF